MIDTTTVQIAIEKVQKSRIAELQEGAMGFGKVFSDHMFIADYKDGQWTDLKIVPYDKVPTSPSMSALHYGQAIFEGMKAFRYDNGEVSLFRPHDNFKRLNVSAVRMAMPEIPEEIFMEGLNQLIKLDKNWVPKTDGSALYIRPFMVATDEFIGVKPSDTYRFYIITAPVGKYYAEPIKVLVETNFIRAVEGGVGFVKASGNYGRSLYPTKLAQEKGYQQIIWTDARHHRYIEESGTMNVMVVINEVLTTPPLGDTILAGITRNSVLTLAKEMGIKVEERKISVDELIEAHQKGLLTEMFGVGTAATIAQIALFGFEDKDYLLPSVETRKVSNQISNSLEAIRKGRATDKFKWMEKIS